MDSTEEIFSLFSDDQVEVKLDKCKLLLYFKQLVTSEIKDRS